MDKLKLEDLVIYQLATEIGEHVWMMVSKWEYFPKTTVGKQFVEAADSISANIAEGYGRYFYKERKAFCYYGRGSLMETKSWAYKALKRALIEQEEYDTVIEKLQVLHFKLNGYIKTLKSASTP